MPADFTDVLEFWFGAPDSPALGCSRREWFEKNPAFDAEISARFLGTHEAAAAGRLATWERTPLAALALIVVLDQFSRNMFRGAARAFAADKVALDAARRAVDNGFDGLLRPVERLFLYLPFEHSEDAAAQRRSLRLFATLADESGTVDNHDYARRHYDIVARFGRFPHRNAVLGRESTAQELEFLKQPGSAF